MSSPTINICQTQWGWTWHVPACSKYKDVKFGPFKIEALAQKHCFFYLKNRRRIEELLLKSMSRRPYE